MNKILVIEDNELNLKLMKDILISQGYDVDTAADGEQGLEKAMENEYGLILLDIQMPVVSGYDFLQIYNKKTPVIVVSACAMETEINKAKELGCADYISKPIQMETEINKAKELGCADYISKPIQIMEFLNTVKKYI